ncbi:MAG: cupin domain-containing protein [Proteobacteria bacterium]|nr:cupin domain-containing protein [Pseudomonadota bacterium]
MGRGDGHGVIDAAVGKDAGGGMAIHFNESEIEGVTLATGVRCQRLIDAGRIPDIRFRLDRVTLGAGSGFALAPAAGDLAWFQVIDGSATLRRDAQPDKIDELDESFVCFLPPSFRASLVTRAGAVLVVTTVPDVAEIDPALADHPPPFRLLDWTREPILQSKHDARKRIYLATSKLFATKAIKGEMINYPPHTEAVEHHHEGGAHFMYFLKGSGTCWAAGKPMQVRKGDVVYYFDREPHNLRGGPDGMAFSEFFVPGGVRTIWADPSKICTWIPTGKNIRGGIAARDITEHAHSELADV